MPIIIYSIKDPQVAIYLTIFALTSKNNEIMINANHRMTIPRSRSISTARSLIFPYCFTISIAAKSVNVIQEYFSSTFISHSAKHPNCVIKAFTRSMMLSWNKLLRPYNWTNNSKLLDFIYSSDDLSSERSIVSLDFKCQRWFITQITYVKYSIVIKNLSLLKLNKGRLQWAILIGIHFDHLRLYCHQIIILLSPLIKNIIFNFYNDHVFLSLIMID